MRSRNIEFVAKKVKPLTRLYAFFDGVDISKYCVPKLLEITMTSGTFEVGETVVGTSLVTGNMGSNTLSSNPFVQFRVAQSNHKEGPYDAPTKTFRKNPYNSQDLSGAYSSTTTILNVDTFSLSNEAQGQYYGWVREGMVLRGQTSGAIASISNIRLISDISAALIGSFYIPDPNNISFPKFATGSKVFTLTDNIDNNQDQSVTLAEEGFASTGTLETVQENIVSVRNAKVETQEQFQSEETSRNLGTEVVGSTVIARRNRTQRVGTRFFSPPDPPPPRWGGGGDPLSQSFIVEDSTGVFLTSCDIFFRAKDDMDIPVVFQLRTIVNGLPSTRVLPFSEVVLDPDDIQTSPD